jgi:hypothetical protein
MNNSIRDFVDTSQERARRNSIKYTGLSKFDLIKLES